jgi:hypothetical protein
MIVVFTPAKSGALRQYRSGDHDLLCDKAGEYEVSEAVGKELCADYPDNFKPAGGTKSSASPTHNRSAQKPGRNKGA